MSRCAEALHGYAPWSLRSGVRAALRALGNFVFDLLPQEDQLLRRLVNSCRVRGFGWWSMLSESLAEIAKRG
jgi:hypothetical protein